MGATCTVQTLRNSCKFFSESDKKMVTVISKIQVSDPGPSWPTCLLKFCMDKALSCILYGVQTLRQRDQRRDYVDCYIATGIKCIFMLLNALS